MFNIFKGIILILFSIATYTSGTFTPYYLHNIEIGFLKYPLSFITFYFGIRFLIYHKTIIIDDEEKVSKCPNCKESFDYAELKNGKCKYCDETDTIEIDEYYKKYPEELKDI